MPATVTSDGRLRIVTAPTFAPLLGDSRYQVAKGGRGAGRSNFFAEKLVERCIERQPTSGACIREVQKSLRFSAKRVIEKKIRDFKATDSFTILDNEIRTPGGGVIIFQGMQNHTAESVQSLEDFDVAWCEEARSLSQRSLDLLRPTIRKTGSELWFSYNPKLPKDPIDLFFSGMFPDYNKAVTGYNKEADAVFVHSNWYDNPWFPDELRKEKDYDFKRDKDKYQHTWLGGYQRSSTAAVFRNWKVSEFETPRGCRFYFGGDWGFSVDPAVAMRCFFGRWEDEAAGIVIPDDNARTLFFDYEAYQIGCEIDHIPALFAGDDKIHAPNTPFYWPNPKGKPGIPDILKWPIIADSQRPDTISYLKNRGFSIEAAVKGARSVEEGVEFLQSYNIVVHPRCVHTADEFASYSYKVDEKTDEVLPVLADKDNHVIDSARYAIEKKRRAGVSMTDYL